MRPIAIFKGFLNGEIFWRKSPSLKTGTDRKKVHPLAWVNPLTWALAPFVKYSKTKTFKVAFYIANLPIIAIGALVISPFAFEEYIRISRAKTAAKIHTKMARELNDNGEQKPETKPASQLSTSLEVAQQSTDADSHSKKSEQPQPPVVTEEVQKSYQPQQPTVTENQVKKPEQPSEANEHFAHVLTPSPNLLLSHGTQNATAQQKPDENKPVLGKALPNHENITSLDTFINANILFWNAVLEMKALKLVADDLLQENIMCDTEGNIGFAGKFYKPGELLTSKDNEIDDECYHLLIAQKRLNQQYSEGKKKKDLQAAIGAEEAKKLGEIEDFDEELKAVAKVLIRYYEDPKRANDSPYKKGLFDETLIQKQPFNEYSKKICDINEVTAHTLALFLDKYADWSGSVRAFLLRLEQSPFLRLGNSEFLKEVTSLLNEVKEKCDQAGVYQCKSYPHRSLLVQYILALHTKSVFPEEWKRYEKTHPNHPLRDEIRNKLLDVSKPKKELKV